MASIGRDQNGLKRILFVSRDGSRKTVRLGKCSQRDAEGFKLKLESLLSANLMGGALDRDTSLWLASVGDDLHAKLAAVGLVEARKPVSVATLDGFIDDFISGRADKSSGTIAHYQRAKLRLVEFFGADKPLSAVTPHDADRFGSWLKATKGHAENTARGHLKNAKLIFGAAVRAKLITENPFKGISTQLVKRPDRMAFIDDKTIQKVLDACPTSRWKAIVVLCRYAGLRCPSEIFALRWADIDFDRGRMKVRSPKGEGFGKGVREVPLFHQVRHALDELYLEPDGGEYVISTNDRSSQKNLRTVFEKILKRANVDPWERLFQNLRASRETELAKLYPLHLVTAWLGNTPKVAMESYLLSQDADFEKAAQIPAQQPLATSENVPHCVPSENEQPLVSQAKPTKQGVVGSRLAPRLGFEASLLKRVDW